MSTRINQWNAVFAGGVLLDSCWTSESFRKIEKTLLVASYVRKKSKRHNEEHHTVGEELTTDYWLLIFTRFAYFVGVFDFIGF